MNIFKVLTDKDYNIISYSYLTDNSSLVNLNKLLYPEFNFPRLNGSDSDRLGNLGGTLLYREHWGNNHFIVDLDFKSPMYKRGEFYLKIETLINTIKRDMKIGNILYS